MLSGKLAALLVIVLCLVLVAQAQDIPAIGVPVIENADPVVGPFGGESNVARTPGSVIRLGGQYFYEQTDATPSPFLQCPWTFDCAGTSVTVNGVNAPVGTLFPYVVFFQVPWETVPGDAEVVVHRKFNGEVLSSKPFVIHLKRLDPHIYERDGVFFPNGTMVRGWPASNQMEGLGQTNPPTVTGEGNSNETAEKPRVFVGGVEAEVTSSRAKEEVRGFYNVEFTVPLNAPTGDAVNIWVTIGGETSNIATAKVLEQIAVGPVPEVYGVGDASGGVPSVPGAPEGLPVIVPGGWTSIYGWNLSLNEEQTWSDQITGGALPTSLAGVTLTMNGEPVALSYAGKKQINALAPVDLAGGEVKVIVDNGGSTPTTFTAWAVREAPAFFVLLWTSREENGETVLIPYAAAVHLDGTLAGQEAFSSILGAPVRPVKPGDSVVVYGNSFGPTDPPTPRLSLANYPLELADAGALTMTLGGVPVQVDYAGLVGPGLYQFNIVIPTVAAGTQLLEATINGLTTPDMYLFVEQ
jgi:uncharacterized protein (TIGR03437 family)